MSRETKAKIYKTCVRPIMTYAPETRAGTRKTKARLLRTTEMRIRRTIAGYNLRDRVRNAQIRDICDTQDIITWVRQRRRGWNEHVSRMTEDSEESCTSEDHRLRRPSDGRIADFNISRGILILDKQALSLIHEEEEEYCNTSSYYIIWS